MNFLRRAVVVTLCSLLPLVLLSFGLTFSLYQVLGSPNHIEKALDESKIYDAAAASLIKQTTSGEGSNTEATSSGEAAIRQAISQSIPPSYIKEQTSAILNGVYAWLRGDTQTLDFSIDLTPVKTSLIENLTNQARARAVALPPCGPELQMAASSDPFSMECLPAGVNPEQLADQTKQSITESEIFKNASISPQTLAAEGNKPLEQQLAGVKDGYQAAKKSVYLTGLLAVIFVAVIIFINRPRQAGIKRVAFILMSVGGMGIITAIIGNFAAQAITDSIAKKGADAISARAADAVRLLAGDLRNWWLILGTLSLAVAITTLVGLRIWNKKHRAVTKTPTR